MPDTRDDARAHFEQVRFSWKRTATIALVCVMVAYVAAWWPSHEGLSDPGRVALFIVLVAAGLWVTEAIPAFAVSLLVIGLEVLLLGRPWGAFANLENDWQQFIAPWGSPLIWLFLGGFVLAEGATKTGLDQWMARVALRQFGERPAIVLLGAMLVTAVLSMFMSNTATATLMTAVLLPFIASAPASETGFAKAMLLGIAAGANIGGMGTIIGSPPNAIAAGALASVEPIGFARWMLLGLPPACLLLALGWAFLVIRYLGRGAFAADRRLGESILVRGSTGGAFVPRAIVVVTFAATVLLWITNPLHGVPITAVSLIPTCLLPATGILTGKDIRALPWDVLLLIAGGLALGVAVQETGLAQWLASQLPVERFGPATLALAFAYLTLLFSNLMSNTAMANLLVPIALAVSLSSPAGLVVPLVLTASAAMCLPVSTPPNAIVYGSGRLTSRDLLALGLVVGSAAPVVIYCWVWLVLSFG